MALNVVMLGPPGAGKGTQASRLARARQVPHISTGDILREGARERNPVVLEAKARMDRGELADDALMIAVVRDRLARPDATGGFVLDGFPRTVRQAEALDAIIESRGTDPLVVVNVAVSDAVIVERLAARRICRACGQSPAPTVAKAGSCPSCGGELEQRADDAADVVRERLRVYERSTRPVLEYYRGRAAFRTVDGARPADDVATALGAVVDDACASVVPARAKGRSEVSPARQGTRSPG